ncbi:MULTISPECIES: hypothetical protein [unclassified Roseibium]|uniref:hypothetical protein n=1 Tax=unclassified Roseibium TaxID=2629323 RepID=UPI00273E21C3|nr:MULTISPECIES: hypothetical protein [unclassified Roseibium]
MSIFLGQAAWAADKSVEDYLLEGQQVMHLSCKGVVDLHGNDETAIMQVVEKMAAVSLINRQIDIPSKQLTEQEEEEIWLEFADALADACADDADQLLAGIIDRAIAGLIQFY